MQRNDCGHDWETGETQYESDDVCLPDNDGYRTCSRDKGWWTVQCGSNTKCKCRTGFMITLSRHHKRECRCQGGKPSFPDTGVITWKGIATKERPHDYTSRPNIIRAKFPFEGKMYKDENGLFMLKQSYVGKIRYRAALKEMVRIVVPNSDGKFTQITREGKEQCEVKDLDENKENFDILYKFVKEHGDSEGIDGFELREDKASSTDHTARSQVWGGYAYQHYGYHYTNDWKFSLKVRQDGLAEPIKFYKISNTDHYTFRRMVIDYSFKPVGKPKQKTMEEIMTEYCS